MATTVAELQAKFTADTSGLDAGTKKAGGLIGGLGTTAKVVGAAAGLAVAGFVGKSIFAAANFEQAMSGVAASLGGVGNDAGITEAQFHSLSEEALRIGATTSVGASEAAMAMDLLAKAGVGIDEIYSGYAQAVVNVAEATGETLNQSASTVGSLQNLFRDTGITASEMSDIVVNAMNASDASMSEFQTGIANLAPVIAGTGMDFAEAAGLITFFNSQGMAAARVGSSLTSMYMNLVNPTTDMANAQKALGISVYDTNGQFIGLPGILDQVRTATMGMTDAQRDAWITQLFGADALDVVSLALKSNEGALEDHIDAMDEQGSAARASAERLNNLKGDVEGLKGAIETLSIRRLGSLFLPALRGVTQGLTGFVEGLGSVFEYLMLVAEEGATVNDLLLAFPDSLQPVVLFMGRMTQAAGDLVDAFQDLLAGDMTGFFDELRESGETAWRAISQLATTTLDWVLDTGVPTVVGWVVDHAGDVWSGIKTLAGWAFNGIADLGSWVLDVGIPSVVGAITGIAGRAADWLKGYLISGASGRGTGAGRLIGNDVSLRAAIADWSINVALPTITGGIAAIAGRFGDWIKGYLFSGASGRGTGAGRLTGTATPVLDIGALTLTISTITFDAGRSIGTAIRFFVLNIVSEITAVDWVATIKGALTSSFNLGQTVGEWISGIDWGSYITADNFVTVGTYMAIGIAGAVGLAVFGPLIIATAIVAMIGAAALGVVEGITGIDFSDVAGALTGAISKAISGMIGFAENIKNTLIQEFTEAKPGPSDLVDLATGAASALASAIPTAIGAAVGFAAGIKEKIVQEFREAVPSVEDFASIAGSIVSALWDAMVDKASQYNPLSLFGLGGKGRDVGGGKDALGDLLGGASGETHRGAATSRSIASVAIPAPDLSQYQAGLARMAPMTQQAMQSARAAVQSAMTQIPPLIRSYAQQATAMWQSGLAPMPSQTMGLMNQVSSAVRSALSPLPGQARGYGASVASSFTGGLSAINQAGGIVNGAMSAVKGAMSGASAGAYGYGAAVGNQFAAGLRSSLGAISSAAAQIRALMPSSPAKTGPLSKPISWDYITDALARSMRDSVGVASAGVGDIHGALNRRGNLAWQGRYGGGGGQSITIVTLDAPAWAAYLRKMDMGERAYLAQGPQSRVTSMGLSRG